MKKGLRLFLSLLIYICLLGIVCLAILFIARQNGHLMFFDFTDNSLLKEKEKTVDEVANNGLSIENTKIFSRLGTQDDYYYKQISKEAKIIYDKLVENKEDIIKGEANIILEEPEFDDMLLKENGQEALRKDFQCAVDALRYDDVSWFVVDFTKMTLKTMTYTRGDFKWFDISLGVKDGEDSFLLDGLDESSAEKMIKKVESERQEILKNASGSDYQKVLYVHDWIVDNLVYDDQGDLNNTRNIYGALIDKKVVCEGYAKVLKYLLDDLDIACILLSGTAINSEGEEENHMWNYIELDGTWYSMDVTWDDPIIVGDGTLNNESRYKYFCQGDNIYKNHTLTSTITDEAMEYDYPKLYHKD